MRTLLLGLFLLPGFAAAGPASLTVGDEVIYERGSKQTGLSLNAELVGIADDEDASTGFPDGSCFGAQVKLRRALARLCAAEPERCPKTLDWEAFQALEQAGVLPAGGNDPEETGGGYSWWNYELADGRVRCRVHGEAPAYPPPVPTGGAGPAPPPPGP